MSRCLRAGPEEGHSMMMEISSRTRAFLPFAASLILALSSATIVEAQTASDTPVEAAPVSPVEGVWRTQLLSEVTIAACPEGFCGTLSHIVVPEGMLSGAEVMRIQPCATGP
jgi:hypothetical protein